MKKAFTLNPVYEKAKQEKEDKQKEYTKLKTLEERVSFIEKHLELKE